MHFGPGIDDHLKSRPLKVFNNSILVHPLASVLMHQLDFGSSNNNVFADKLYDWQLKSGFYHELKLG